MTILNKKITKNRMESLGQQVSFSQMEWCQLWVNPVIMELTG